MRPDMSKVIVERPRRGSERHVARRFRRFDPKLIDTSEDADGTFAGGVGHRRAAALAGDCKSLNENLTPLRRFLISQVGRPWSSSSHFDFARGRHRRGGFSQFVDEGVSRQKRRAGACRSGAFRPAGPTSGTPDRW